MFSQYRKGERPESVSPKKANPKAVPKVEALEVEDDDGFISASQQNRSSRKHAMRGETSKERGRKESSSTFPSTSKGSRS